jgi:hypothetical protein
MHFQPLQYDNQHGERLFISRKSGYSGVFKVYIEKAPSAVFWTIGLVHDCEQYFTCGE